MPFIATQTSYIKKVLLGLNLCTLKCYTPVIYMFIWIPKMVIVKITKIAKNMSFQEFRYKTGICRSGKAKGFDIWDVPN